MSRDPRIDDYIAGRAAFALPILTHLRGRLHAACPELGETIKWGMPAFTYRGRPLANMAAFKAHASFGFWDRAALTTGREGSGMGQYGRIASLADLPPDAELDSAIRAQMALIDSGARTRRAARTPKPEATVPAALRHALDADPAARAVFDDRFAPSHRREYCEWIAEAKRPATQQARIAQALEWIRDGKQRNWKYQR
jgi:hypothetical protein